MQPNPYLMMALMREREEEIRRQLARRMHASPCPPRRHPRIATLLRILAARLDPQYGRHATGTPTNYPAAGRAPYDPCSEQVV